MGVHICVCARIYTLIQTHQRVHTMHPRGATYVNARPDVGTRICESQHTAHLRTMHAHTLAHAQVDTLAQTGMCMHMYTLAPVYIHPHTCIRAHARTHVHTALVLLSRLQWPSLGRTHISRFQTQHSCLHSSCSTLREATAKRKQTVFLAGQEVTFHGPRGA